MNVDDKMFKIFMDKHSLNERISEMSTLYEEIKGYENTEVQLHFSECHDETLWLTLQEIDEWFDFLMKQMNDESVSKYRRLQKLIDAITEAC